MYSKIKVAAYCRVSTDFSDQLNSLATQRNYFNEYINNHDEWELVEIYYDEGITGTSTKHREGFNRMIADCESGKIQLILTKEVSRFARNTIDTLTYTRKLSDLGIGVIFMNDGIDTRDKDGELRLSIMASIAQEESRKISERVKWGMKRRMENGVVLGCGRIYGFKVVDGKLEIVPDEAEIVKEIFHQYLYEGKGSTRIAKDLTERGIPTLNNRIWSPQHVLKILANDKYVGDLTQWKFYKPNVLAERRIPNKGDCPDSPLITVKDHHEAIISREVWDATQQELERRGKLTREGRKHSKSYWFSGKCKCGKCGFSYINASSSSHDYRYLGCRNRQLNGKDVRTAPTGEVIGCDNHSVDERILSLAMKTLLEYVKDLRKPIEAEMVEEIQQMQTSITAVDTTSIKADIDKLKSKRLKAVDLMLEGLISKEALKEQTDFYDKEISALTEKLSISQDISSKFKKQTQTIHKAIEKIRSLSDGDLESTELYGEMLQQAIFPNYGQMKVYLCGMPCAFDIAYSIKKAPRIGIYDITIEKCEAEGL